MSARDLINAGAASSAAAIYVEDVFSTYLYTGNGLSVGYKDIVNNIPLNSSSAWWGAKWVGPTGGAFGTRVTADPSGNVYVCGYVVDTFGKSFIAKYNSSGTLQWQRIVSQSSSSGYALGITSDSSGNVYITGYATDTLQHAYVIKYNTSGTLQWHRKLQNGSTRGRGIAVDSSGNVYVTGSFQSDSRVFTAKYNSSGTLQWQRQITPVGSEYAGQGVDIAADSSGNVYVTASIDQNHTFATILVLKYNTSGTLQWHRKAYQHNSYAGGIAVDSSGNVYIGGSIAVTSGSYPNNGTSGYIIKYNTSGTLQWQRKLSITPGGGNIVGISVDSSGNSYVAGNCGDTSGGSLSVLGLIAKYNTSGTLQWQRYFRHGNGVGQNGGYPFGIYADSSNVYVTGSSDGSDSSGFVIKISQDGNTSGTVNGGTLSVGTATESAGTATDFAGTTTDTAGSATESAGTATDAVGTATSTTQVINAVDGGGLVWMKARTNTGSPIDHALYDSVRGTTKELSSNHQVAQYTVTNGLTAFGANGFTIGAAQNINSTAQYVSWTFRKQPKFFDIVTYTGNGSANRSIPHSLGSTPGFIVIKRTSATGFWYCWHRNYTGAGLYLNSSIVYPGDSLGFDASQSSTTINLSGSVLNNSGSTYVAYLFAHDAGGFGISGTDNVISCGSVTTPGVPGVTTEVNLGWEPQWILLKNTTNEEEPWYILDSMRGMTVSVSTPLLANSPAAESPAGPPDGITATGFKLFSREAGPWIYIAIRRGPMRTPTTGTSVFASNAYNGTGTSTIQTLVTNFPVDAYINTSRQSSGSNRQMGSRLVGKNKYIPTDLAAAEQNLGGGNGVNNSVGFESNIGIGVAGDWNNPSSPSYSPYIDWEFRRAPGFFDVVCYTGTGSARTVTHNLGVAPEFIIVKNRTASGIGTADWAVYHSGFNGGSSPWNYKARLNFNDSVGADNWWGNTAPTATVFSVSQSGDPRVNSINNYVAYLFATCPGVSKVGSYTGNGSNQTINCGFTTGARFVLIKRTDSTGDWYVWDTARGIVAGNDPHLSLNTTAGEVTTNDSVDPDSTGFVVNQVSATNVNLGPVFSQINTSPIGSVENARSLNGKLLICGATDSSQTVAMVRSVEDATSYTVFTGSNSNFIRDIAYGNGVYVVVGAQNVYTSKIYYSTNLSSWTEASHPSLIHGYQRVCFGNGVFVAAGNNNGGTGNYVAYSTDGITWNSTSVPNRATFLSFVNGQFVAFGSNMGTIYTSTNGSTWSTISTGLGGFIPCCDIVYGAGVYVTMRSEGPYGKVVYSTNLSSWTEGQSLPYDSSMSIGYNSVTNRFLSLGRHVGNDLEYAHQSTVGSPTAFSEIMNIPATRTWLTPFIHNGGMVAPYNTYSSGAYTYDKPQYIYLAIA